jgi:hypothetical protein
MEPEYEQILGSKLPDVEKLARAFLSILNQSIVYAEHEIELRKALNDEQGLIKEQIKRDTLKYSEDILAFCFYRTTGRKLSDG